MPVLWMPRKEAARLSWLANFVTQLANLVGIAGITPADVASAEADYAAYAWLVDLASRMQAAVAGTAS